jgi:hypothetical protein
VAVVVANDDEGLEARALAGAGLLLHGVIFITSSLSPGTSWSMIWCSFTGSEWR